MHLPDYHPNEERLNYLTHGFGAILSVIGFIFLVWKGLLHKDNWILLGLVVFGLSMLSTYVSSTLYHWVEQRRLKKRMRLFDHMSIYLLIAGTYTPFTLGNLRADWGFVIVGLIWGMAILGMIYKIAFRHHFDKLGAIDTFFYIGMGFLVVLFFKPALRGIDFWGMCLLALGGLFYMVGVYFYESKTIKYNHAIWHLFVMGGSFCHFFSVLYYANPPHG